MLRVPSYMICQVSGFFYMVAFFFFFFFFYSFLFSVIFFSSFFFLLYHFWDDWNFGLGETVVVSVRVININALLQVCTG